MHCIELKFRKQEVSRNSKRFLCDYCPKQVKIQNDAVNINVAFSYSCHFFSFKILYLQETN